MKYTEIIQELISAAMSPKKTVVRSMKETGKKAIGISPVYGPDEVVYAAGCLPIALWGGHTEFEMADKYLQSFCCSVIRADVYKRQALITGTVAWVAATRAAPSFG